MEQTLLMVPEAARLLRISRNLAYELVARGQLPHLRLGRVIRVPSSVLDAWIERSTHRGTDLAGRDPAAVPSVHGLSAARGGGR
jgi:excisionase family DNA binding protein